MKKVLLLLSLPLLFSCADSKKSEPYTGQYFKKYYDKVEQDSSREYSFLTLYDAEDNRFSVTFGYGLHFFYELKITEYDINDWYHSPNEGVFAEDYESVSFTFNAASESELFPDGTYILSHQYVENKHAFTLSVNGNVLPLTTQKKTRPTFINDGLIGEFSYKENNQIAFTLSCDVGPLSRKRPVIITLKEGELSFGASTIIVKSSSVSFTIGGDYEGQYVKFGSASLSVDSAEQVTLKIGRKSYKLTKESGPVQSSYFGDENNHSTYSNKYVSMTLSNLMGTSFRYIQLSELQEGGRKDWFVLFNILDEGNRLTNKQSLGGNLIFTSDSTVSLVHSVVNDHDKVDLYKDGILLYESLIITEI